MSINEQEQLHGVVALRLWEALSTSLPEVNFSLAPGRSQSSYQLTGLLPKTLGKGKSCSTGLFIKVAHARRSPWRYNFHIEHQKEILDFYKANEQVFVIFVAGLDGIACLDYQQLKQILDDTFEEQEAVSVSRKPRQNYRISGNDGKLETPLPKNVFPNKIVDFFKARLEIN